MVPRRVPRKCKPVTRIYEDIVAVDEVSKHVTGSNGFLSGTENGKRKRKPRRQALRTIQVKDTNAPGLPHKNQRYKRVSVTEKAVSQHQPPIIDSVDSLSELVVVKPDLRSLLTKANRCWCCDTCDKEFSKYSLLAQHVGENTCNSVLEYGVPVPVGSWICSSESATARKVSGTVTHFYYSFHTIPVRT